MRSSKALLVAGLLGLAATIGCMGQPLVSQQLGLLPGPSVALLTQVYAASSPLGALASLLGNTTGTSGSDTTGTTGNCPAGQVYIAPLKLCIPQSLASQFGIK